jgi:hypothetical protein
VKVGDLVRWKALRGEPLVGLIVGFDKESDPMVRDCKSGVIIAHWRSTLEVLSEVPKSR